MMIVLSSFSTQLQNYLDTLVTFNPQENNPKKKMKERKKPGKVRKYDEMIIYF